MHVQRLLPVLLATAAVALKPFGDQVCVATCYNALAKANYTAETEKAQASCKNPLKVKSTYYCIWQRCAKESTKATEDGIEWWGTACKNSSKVVSVKGYHAAVANLTEEYLAALPTVEHKAKTVFDGPAIPSQANWKYMYTTVFTYADARRYNDAVRWSIYGFWGFIILLGIINRLWSLLFRRHRTTPIEAQTGELSIGRKISKWLNIHLLQAPTATHNHHEPWGWFTVPLRAQTIVIILYLTLHVGVIASRYHIYDQNDYFKSRRSQILRYLADRLGTMISSTMPFIFLFGARSSPLPIITGWSYRTFSAYHRWVAIILFIEGILHGCVFSAFYVNDKGWSGYHKSLKSDSMFRTGITMLIAIGISAAFAHIKIRQKAYEVFKMAHIAMAVLFLVFYYYHVKDKFAGDYEFWTWVCIAIWASDYVFRALRILYLNFNSLIGKDNRAIASYSEETGMIRLQVHASGVSSKQNPGTYYHLHFGGWRVWENHPFSLAGSSAGEVAPVPSTSSGDEKRITQVDSQPTATDPLHGQSYKTFMIRPRNGFTRRLRDSIAKKDPSGISRLRVVLEGPYGTAANINGFNEILFVAGGSGITAILPYIRQIFEDADPSAPCPNVRLTWVVRTTAFARDVLANDLRLVEASQNASKFHTDIYVTSGNAADTASEKSDSENTVSGFRDSTFSYRRPDVANIVREYVGSVQSNRAAVFVCGPAIMADETRAAVRKEAKMSSKDIELFEEMYGW